MNTTTPTDSPENVAETEVKPDHHDHAGHHDHPLPPAGRMLGDHYYTELIRIVTGLFVGLLALMTFLLTIGYQRPHANFSWALYASIVTLALNLVAYVFGHILRQHKSIRIVRAIQQILFVAAVVSVTCLALATAAFFFSINPSAASGAAAQ